MARVFGVPDVYGKTAVAPLEQGMLPVRIVQSRWRKVDARVGESVQWVYPLRRTTMSRKRLIAATLVVVLVCVCSIFGRRLSNCQAAPYNRWTWKFARGGKVAKSSTRSLSIGTAATR